LSADENRLQSILRTMKTTKDRISSRRIFGIWNKEASELFEQMLDSLSADARTRIAALPPEAKQDALQTVNPLLEDFLSLVDTVRNNICENSPVHELISYVLRDLNLSDKIRYLVCLGGSLSTFFLVKGWLKWAGWALFPSTREFLEKYQRLNTDFFVFFIPPVVLEDRAYWVAIGHEIGHVIEHLHSLVESIYPEVRVEDSDTPEGMDYFHSREYVSDYIANGYFGPIYYDVAYELLYVLKIRLYGTHPPYDARLYFLQKELEDVNVGRNKIQQPPSSQYTSILKLGQIISGAKNLLTTASCYYSANSDDAASAVENLKLGLPYIGAPRTVLNAYWEKRSEVLAALSEIMKERGRDPAQVQALAGSIIGDSIRLTNMQRTFQVMKKEEEDRQKREREKETKEREERKGRT